RTSPFSPKTTIPIILGARFSVLYAHDVQPKTAWLSPLVYVLPFSFSLFLFLSFCLFRSPCSRCTALDIALTVLVYCLPFSFSPFLFLSFCLFPLLSFSLCTKNNNYLTYYRLLLH